MFTKAIVRKPCPALTKGITTANLGLPDYHKALLQHNRYTDVLRELGLEVTVLEADNRYPDSVFVEDVALCTPHCAIITRPGADSRRGEIEDMKEPLQTFYDTIEEIREPGTLDGGDVMMAGSHYFIGLSERTNEAGADQLIALLEKYGMTGSKVPLGNLLHLKTGISYLENDTLLTGVEFTDAEVFKQYRKIAADPEEAYAANAIWINGTVLVPAGFPKTAKRIEQAGYPIIPIEMTEFEKLDGGLSCLSLRF